MRGFEDSWARSFGGDATQHPSFMSQYASQFSNRDAVTNYGRPEAVSDVHYLDPDAADKEAIDFKAAMRETGSEFTKEFLIAPSLGILATAIRNRDYGTEEAWLASERLF